jgi:hypothetical protein
MKYTLSKREWFTIIAEHLYKGNLQTNNNVIINIDEETWEMVVEITPKEGLEK